MKYEVWCEGYAATGEHGRAEYLGTYKAFNFEGACDQAVEENYKDQKLYNKEKLSYWCCKLYPTEKEARESFG